MSKQKSTENNKQGSAGGESRQSAAAPAAKSGKDAASHTKADTGKGAGGGAKQERKH